MIEGSCHCGAVHWTFDGDPGSATACNCTVCRRYGSLWIYDYEGERIRTSGQTTTYARGERHLSFHFCPSCGCVTWWRANSTDENGCRIAVNIRLADDPAAVSHLPIRHFDGLGTFEALPSDGKCVSDIWF
jgi:hypothetical protein